MNFLLRGLVAGDGVGAGEAGDVLTEGVAGDVAGHVFAGVEERRGGVPAAHVFAGCGHAGELAEGLEHAVFVEVEEEGVVVAELDEHGAVEELDVGVVELGEGCGAGGGGELEGWSATGYGGDGGDGGGALEEGSAGGGFGRGFGHGASFEDRQT